MRWRTAGRIGIGWLLTLPAAGGVGALAALLVVWLGNWGVAIDAVIAVLIILGLYMRSRVATPSRPPTAMSDVAESGMAIELPDTPPPTRRQQRIEQAKAEARARAEARGEGEGAGEEGLPRPRPRRRRRPRPAPGASKSAASKKKADADRNGESA